jgi:hypothetical protein
VIGVSVGGIPSGAKLSDGLNSFTASDLQHLVIVTGWNLANLSITPPAGFTGQFALSVVASSMESATGEVANTAISLPVTVVASNVTSPLVIDLNGDGVHTTALDTTTGKFDLLNNGHTINSGWISAQDGFLAIDSNGNGNGKIDDRSELFGGEIGEGYAKLASFDSNHDGVVDARDARYNDLKIWQDSNGNHQTDAGEMRSLSEAGISSLNVNHTIVPEQQNGNWLLERGLVTFKDGRTAAVADAYFEIEPQAKGSSASIMLRSEIKQTENFGIPNDDAEVQSKLGGTAVKFYDARKIYKSANIDWNTHNVFENKQSNTAEDEKKKHENADKGKKSSWLADFLGADNSNDKKDVVKMTGLKVKLGEKKDKS